MKIKDLNVTQLNLIFGAWARQFPGALAQDDAIEAAKLIRGYIEKRDMDVNIENINAAARHLHYDLKWEKAPPAPVATAAAIAAPTPSAPASLSASEKLRAQIHDPELMRARREKQLLEDLKRQRENRGPSKEEVAAAEKVKQDAADIALKAEYHLELEAAIKGEIAGYVCYRGNRIDHLRTEEGRKKLAICEMRKGGVRDPEGTLWLVLKGVQELGEKDSSALSGSRR